MLKIEIDGLWEPQDFIEVIGSVESMYCKISAGRSRRYRPVHFEFDDIMIGSRNGGRFSDHSSALEELNQRIVAHSRYTVPSSQRLYVRSIEYASPGGIDFLGIGKACQAIADSIGSMKRYYDDRYLRRERDEQARITTEREQIRVDIERENLRALQIANAREALRVRSEFPEEEEMLVALLVKDQQRLAERIADGKIVRASNRDTEDDLV